uniref:Uncharacterized protein n=1 Tax=Rhizophora mucronata TaxID=61149 RepID=A0A2P2Q4P0_RHIMU
MPLLLKNSMDSKAWPNLDHLIKKLSGDMCQKPIMRTKQHLGEHYTKLVGQKTYKWEDNIHTIKVEGKET